MENHTQHPPQNADTGHALKRSSLAAERLPGPNSTGELNCDRRSGAQQALPNGIDLLGYVCMRLYLTIVPAWTKDFNWNLSTFMFDESCVQMVCDGRSLYTLNRSIRYALFWVSAFVYSLQQNLGQYVHIHQALDVPLNIHILCWNICCENCFLKVVLLIKMERIIQLCRSELESLPYLV